MKSLWSAKACWNEVEIPLSGAFAVLAKFPKIRTSPAKTGSSLCCDKLVHSKTAAANFRLRVQR
jgi:hypothetical protein